MVGRKLMFNLAQGATRYNLSKSYFEKTIIKIPTLAEQTAIATILSDMDAEIEALQAKLNKAKMVKQGAMQKLLTGQIRLNLNFHDEHDKTDIKSRKSFNQENHGTENNQENHG